MFRVTRDTDDVTASVAGDALIIGAPVMPVTFFKNISMISDTEPIGVQ